MRKIIVAFVIAVSVGLFAASCSNSQSTVISIATSTLEEAATPTQALDRTTPEIAPTLTNTPDKNGGLIVTFGERVNRQGHWPAIPAFSPDGKMVALISEKVRLWSVETHELIHELPKSYSNCYTENAIFSSNGKLLATSIYCLSDSNATGHVLIWDTDSGTLLHDWEQVFSKNTSKLEGILNNRPATGIAFLPESSVLAFANGNTIEIRDVKENSKSLLLELGDEMIATDIAISEDGKQLFAFMDFSYPNAPNEIGQKYALQTWDLKSKTLVDKIEYTEPENTGYFIEHFDYEMQLVGNLLIKVDYINKAFEVTNLETGNTRNLDYLGDVETFLSQDANYVIYLDRFCKNQRVELWDTQFSQSLYTFDAFGTGGCYGSHAIVFSPNNRIVAIAHEERVSLWDVSSFIRPKQSGTP